MCTSRGRARFSSQASSNTKLIPSAFKNVIQMSRKYLPLHPLPAPSQFCLVLRNFLLSMRSSPRPQPPSQSVSGLSKLEPYWDMRVSSAKGRWLGRRILDVMTEEFRSRSREFYVSSCFRYWKPIIHKWSFPDICTAMRYDYCQRRCCHARHHT
jgi:hypothetical protein